MSTSQPVKLLLVGEECEYFELIKEQAELCNHQLNITCECATSAADAIKSLQKFHPAVVVVDAHLPDLNSYDMLDKCKEHAAAVIIASDTHSASIEKTAKERGACAYAVNTSNPEEIEELLKRISLMPVDHQTQH